MWCARNFMWKVKCTLLEAEQKCSVSSDILSSYLAYFYTHLSYMLCTPTVHVWAVSPNMSSYLLSVMDWEFMDLCDCNLECMLNRWCVGVTKSVDKEDTTKEQAVGILKYSEVCACVCAGVMHYTCLVLMVCFIFFFFFLIFNSAVNEIDTMTQYTPVKLKEKTLNPWTPTARSSSDMS